MIPRGHRFELGASLLLALACAPSSLVGVPGLESAVVFGVVLPFVFAASAALRTSRARAAGSHEPALAVRAAWLGPFVAMCGITFVQLARHAVEPGCASLEGLPRLLLGPFPGMLLASFVGVAVGAALRSPRRAVALASFVVFASYGVVAYEVIATPAVYVFTVFGGHWPGPVYDDLVALPGELVSYRATTALAIVALGLVLRFGPDRQAYGRNAALVAAFLAGLAFVVVTVTGVRFGHRTSVARIDDTLGAQVAGPRCVVHLPSEVPFAERMRTLAECEAHVRGVERALGVRRRAPLHAFVYRSAEEKGVLVGAADTYVAKPWRGEIHVQREPFPHAVMRHEIVHVIAAELAGAPFGVSGRFFGLVPNPALVEGLAVAVADEARDGFDADAWSRAMLDLDRLPPARALMGAGFLGQGAHASYQAAGSFLAHLLRTEGPGAVGRMYRRGTIGDDARLARYERAWHAHLRSLDVPEAVRELARVRLLDHGLFSTRCARHRERLVRALGEARARFDDRASLALCRRLLAIDRRDAGARLAEVQALARAGRIRDASQALSRVRRDGIAPRAAIARTEVVLGDAIVAEEDARGRADDGAYARAAGLYRAALDVPADEDLARALEVRLLALGASAPVRRVFFDAIADRGREAHPEAAIVASLLAIDEPGFVDLAHYLVARRWRIGPRDDGATRVLRRLSEASLPTERLRRETRRLLAIDSLARAMEPGADSVDRDRARRALTSMLEDPRTRAEARRGLALLAEHR